MSWNIFNRQPKRNLVTKAEERDFERECTKLQYLEESCKKISKDSKKIVAAANAQSRAAKRVGADLVNDLADNTSSGLKEFDSAMNKQAELSTEKANMIQHSLVVPVKDYNTIFPLITTHVKTREKALQEYNKVQAKLEKYEEREYTAANSVKIEAVKKELQPVKESFERKNDTLMKEMPALYSARLGYIHPSLDALLSTQCWYHKETLKALEKCSQEMKVNEDDESTDAQINRILQDIKLLSITLDD